MAHYKIDPNRLDKNELTYELKIRGISPGTVEVMRSNLFMSRRLEKSGDSFTYPTYPYTPDEDVAAVAAKLDDIGPKVADFNDCSSSGQYAKYESKLYHLLHRIDHIPEDRTERPNFRSRVLSLLQDLHTKADNYVRLSSVPPQLHILAANTSSPLTTTPQNITSVPRTPVPSDIKPILPNKWNLQFSGDKKGLSLSAFLERVEELRVARHVSKDTLLESGIDLFAGRAYQFYLAYRGQVTSWDEFVSLLKEEYLSANYNEKLFEEIKRRTQGPDESIGVYIAVMTGYFNRLTCSISEEAKLKILLRNIAPFYQNQLSLVTVRSVTELRSLGKKLEASKEAVQDYVPPTRKTSMLEPDLAYVEADPPIDSCEASTSGQGVRPKPESKNIVCYRCNQPGHMAKGCAVKTKKFCYRCKKDGFTVKTCPQCNKQGKDIRRA